jgi:hypothetical protein
MTIRVLMLDLGDTLAKGDTVFPNVPAALDILTRFETKSSAGLILSLVSDYDMPTPPITPQKVNAIFSSYLAMLDKLHLKAFFEPVERRVTLSTHAGVFKPDPLIFKKALQRLRLRAHLTECLFVTENADHVAACRKLGMTTLLFDPSGSPKADFSDWSEAPLLIATQVAPESVLNKRLALQLILAARYDMQLVRIEDGGHRHNIIRGLATKPFPVSLKMRGGGTEKIAVPFTVNVEISLDNDGRVSAVTNDKPDQEALAESSHFVETLEANNQLSHGEGNLKGSETHELKVDEKGRKLLTRRRYTAS